MNSRFSRDVQARSGAAADRLNAPIVRDRDRGGYRLDLARPSVGPQYELPGLWLSAEQIHPLLTMQHLLADLDAGGLLGAHTAPLMQRLSALLGTGAHASAVVVRRIRVQTVGARKVQVPHFQAVGSALLRRKRLVIDDHGRGRNVRQERDVSPQRLIHYRDSWYSDAWCHLRDGLRSFAVDALVAARVLDRAAIDVVERELGRSDLLQPHRSGAIAASNHVVWNSARLRPADLAR